MQCPMGTVPSFPFAPAVISCRNASVGSRNHAVHGRLAQATPLTAMYFLTGSYSALFMSWSISPFGETLAGASSRAVPSQKSSPDPEVSAGDPGGEATGEDSS
ncbi:hypothetical protein llap_13766 [Limosa lapponica baueri]|uniref:Uncharacterized protein n=1 Tax=Limosa lapponica baueri TaxID=1758121 RepID=A0A2I0TQ62_LIMLA|nr:hypothetical protein llap_13766 [Limosa lapponica baueri]